MDFLRHRLATPLALGLALVVLLTFGAQPALAVDFDGAENDLDQLKKATKSRGSNDDLLQYLDHVFTNYKSLKYEDKPAEDAGAEAIKAWEDGKAKFDKNLDKYRKKAQKLILKIMTLVKVQSETNVRDPVNIHAAKILGEMAPFLDEKGRSDLSKSIVRSIDKRLTKVKTHELNTDLLDAAFAALGALNDVGSLKWMLDEHCHANEVQKFYIIAAHKAMVLFKNVPGKLRKEICDHFVKFYGSVEAQAEKSSTDPKDLAKKRFWDDIKTYTIPVVQYYAGKPTKDDGSALATMLEFDDFMRQHKNARKAPWVDAKPVK